jgi:hypothetical protein
VSNEIDALIAKCEAATGGDREIDAEIATDIAGLCLHGSWHREGPEGDTGRVCDDCGADSWGNKGMFGQRLNDDLPRYTSSIDLIIALIERELPVVRISISIDPSGNGCHIVHWPDGLSGGPHAPEVTAAHVTPALACCAAFLKALRAKRSIEGSAAE